MKAVVYDGIGDASVVKLADVPAPKLKPRGIRIRVHASGVNRADIVQRGGNYSPPPGESDIPGLEVAGEVIEAAPDATLYRGGDRVMALLAGGGYAEEVSVDERVVLPIPPAFSYVEGAATMETFLTAHHNVFTLGNATKDSRVLIHAGASGVGTSALQLLRSIGATVFTTVGSPEKAQFCETLGATSIEYKKVKFEEHAKNVSLILDCIGGSYFEANMQCLAVDGTLVLIGLMGGREAKLDLGRLLMKRHRLVGSTLRALPIERKAAVVASFRDSFFHALVEEKIKPVVDSTFPVEKTKDAQLKMESNANVGKIVLTWKS